MMETAYETQELVVPRSILATISRVPAIYDKTYPMTGPDTLPLLNLFELRRGEVVLCNRKSDY
jgi:hypothetical protein